MKRWIKILMILLAILFIIFLMYRNIVIPALQWQSVSDVNIHTTSFSDAYEESRKKLGIFSGIFTLNHIAVTVANQNDIVDIMNIAFNFFHEAAQSEMYDACTVELNDDSALTFYMRDEPKGICDSLNFPLVYNYADISVEDILILYMNSVSVSVQEWARSVSKAESYTDDIYTLFITVNGDGVVTIRLNPI